MKKIGIISDTHSYWDDRYLKHFEPCDEIWHCGDICSTVLAERFGCRALLVNPAVGIEGNESLLVGSHKNFYSGESFEFTHEHAAQLIDMERTAITPANYQLWVEQGDEVLDWRRAVARYAGCVQRVFPNGDHSFTRFGEMLPQLFEFCGL